jgi:hypothetical protein
MLKKKLDQEKNEERSFEDFPYHYMEIATQLIEQ